MRTHKINRSILFYCLFAFLNQNLAAQCPNGLQPAPNLHLTEIQCSAANLDGSCFTMYAENTSDQCGTYFTPGCGNTVVSNANWFVFIATSDTITFQFLIGNCLNNDGVQMGLYDIIGNIYEADTCNTNDYPIERSVLVDQAFCFNPIMGATQWPNVPVTPGKQYALLVDGWGGDVCEVEINIIGAPVVSIPSPTDLIISSTGFQDPGIGELDTVCPGAMDVQIHTPKIPFASNYIWEFPDGTTAVSHDTNVLYSFPFSPGDTATFCVRGKNSCDTSSSFCKSVIIGDFVIQCNNSFTGYLNSSGTIVLNDQDILTSNLSCSYDSLHIDPPEINCNSVGNVPIQVTAYRSGYGTTCSAEVTIFDTLSPMIHCTNFLTFYLNQSGTLEITHDDILGFTTDNCTISYSMNQNTFTCADIGDHTMQIIATDPSGNSDTCSTIISIIENFAPIIHTQDITIDLDQNMGTASIVAEDLNFNTTDNCGLQSFSVDKTLFSCSDPDINYVIFSATDVNGNTSSAIATVTLNKPAKRSAWVSELASGNNNGLTKIHAFNNLQDALEAQGCIENVNLIRLVEGTYYPSNFGDSRISSFNMPDTIEIRGGFPLGSGSRDPELYISRLSGNLGNSLLKTDNAYHVVTIPSQSKLAILDGLEISGGVANTNDHSQGAGVLVEGVAKFKNVRIFDCASVGEGANIHVKGNKGNLTILGPSSINMLYAGPSLLYVDKNANLLILKNVDLSPN